MTVQNTNPVLVHLGLIGATSKRIFRQLRHDPHTVAMAVAVPSALVILVRFVLNSEDEFNASAPPLLAIFPFSVMFLVTSIATLRERTTGTLERLMTYSLARIDLLLGYVVAFALVAAAQVLLMVTISMAWLGLTIDGSVVVLVLIAVLTAILGVAFGLLASVIARTEYQVVQLLPIVVLPQVLIGGLFAPRESMASALESVSDVLPLPEAVEAVSYVADSGSKASTMVEDILFITGYTVVTLAVGATTLSRKSRDGQTLVGMLVAKVRSLRRTLPSASPSRNGHAPMAGRFELYVDRSGKYRFRLRNGEGVLAASAAFMTQAEAEEAIQALCRTVPSANIDDQTNGSTPSRDDDADPPPTERRTRTRTSKRPHHHDGHHT